MPFFMLSQLVCTGDTYFYNLAARTENEYRAFLSAKCGECVQDLREYNPTICKMDIPGGSCHDYLKLRTGIILRILRPSEINLLSCQS